MHLQVPSGVQRLSIYIARREAPSLMGRVDGLDGHQKCPLKFFKLCEYLELVYIYLYTKLKLSPTLLWVSKFHVKLGVWFDGMGRVGRMGRSSKVSFKILHILWVCRLSIYLLIHEIKIVTDILMGFKI